MANKTKNKTNIKCIIGDEIIFSEHQEEKIQFWHQNKFFVKV